MKVARGQSEVRGQGIEKTWVTIKELFHEPCAVRLSMTLNESRFFESESFLVPAFWFLFFRSLTLQLLRIFTEVLL